MVEARGVAGRGAVVRAAEARAAGRAAVGMVAVAMVEVAKEGAMVVVERGMALRAAAELAAVAAGVVRRREGKAGWLEGWA